MEYQKSRKPGRLFTFSLLLLDVVAITSLYCLLVLMRHSQQFTEFFYPSALVVTIVTALATLALVGGYDRNTDMLGIRFMSEHLIASGIAFFISAVIIYAMTAYGADLHPPRASLAIIFLIFPVLSLFYRELLATRLYEDLGKRSLFVLGTGEQARQFYTQLRALQWPQRVSFFATEETEEEKKGTRLISDDPDSPPYSTISSRRCNRKKVRLRASSSRKTQIEYQEDFWNGSLRSTSRKPKSRLSTLSSLVTGELFQSQSFPHSGASTRLFALIRA